MKKVVLIFLIALFVVNNLHAQSTDVLTNTTIIKMVKGKLSDDLIIEEINSSKVNFDLSDEGIKTLSAANVSEQLIKAMKASNKVQAPATIVEPTNPAIIAAPAVIVPAAVVLSQAESPAASAVLPVTNNSKVQTPVELQPTHAQVALVASIPPAKDTVTELVAAVPPASKKEITAVPAFQATDVVKSEPQVKKLTIEAHETEKGVSILIEQPALTIETVSYVQPVTDLIPFYNNEFSSLASVIRDWDKKLRTSLEKEKQSLLAISKIEKELTSKKNLDAKPFSQEIIDQKKNLVLLWEQHKKIKSDMVAEGKSLVEELTKISKETDGAIDTKYKEVSKNVKSAEPDPSAGKTVKTATIPLQKFTSLVTGYFTPLTMMLVCYQNEIISLQNTIVAWNEKALSRIQKDSVLKSQLSPLQAELTQYLATTKQDQKLKKKEISALKKQCDAIEKERKQLAKQMADDSVKLSEELNKMKTEAQSIVQERFTDIIGNIDHSYQDKFNL